MLRAHAPTRAVVALGIILACCSTVFALNPSLNINQYAHTAWTVREGFFKGAVNAISQTPDGYLWLGTEFGLLRFDGARSVPWSAPAGEHLPSNNILSLLVTRDGRLWIGTAAGLASWKDGRLTHYPELAGQTVLALLVDRQGTTWAGSFGAPTGRLCAIQGGEVHCSGTNGSLGLGVFSLYEYRGDLWVGAATGLWRWNPGPAKFYPLPYQLPEIHALIEGDNGALWMAVTGEMRQLVGDRTRTYPLSAGQFRPYKLMRDRQGGLWVGSSSQGLLHLHQGSADRFTAAEGLSGENVNSFFEDRESNIWVATNDGLDRFRDFAVPTISFKHESGAIIGSVLAAVDGTVWLGTSDGLSQWRDGPITIYRKRREPLPARSAQAWPTREIIESGLPDNVVESLFQDGQGRIWVSTLRGLAYLEEGRFVPVSPESARIVHSIVEGSPGNLWISDQENGLLHFLDGRKVGQIPWAKLGHQDWATVMIADPVHGGLWLGFYYGGVAFFKDGRVRAAYAASDGLGEGRVTGLQLDQDGTLWTATQGGLSRVKNGRVATLTSRNGLPCDALHWLIEDDANSFWLYMQCGLVRVARSELNASYADPKRTVNTTVFDNSDGVKSLWSAGGYSPGVVKSSDGRLWFVTRGDVSVIDPRQIAFNKFPAPVRIEQITADGTKSQPISGLRLPALVRDVWIDYTALSFVAPEKVRFRYKLEGQDKNWTEVVNQRQVHYSNLRPRNYRFRVAASNNRGVWNENGASFDFSVAPAYYQTTWFLVSCVAAFLVFLWGLYRYRLYQIAREFNANLEGRVDERLRVARDLHDTLLQSFHGLLPRLQAAVNLLPGRASDARQVLEAAVDDAAQAIGEARDAVQDMRRSATTENDLAKAVESMGQQLGAHHKDVTGKAPAFSLEVEGTAQNLHPILRDEIYRIASEALRNAFHHAEARGIEVEIRYDPRQLRVRLRDDGIGIAPDVLRQEGREGHFGVDGMRERAKSIGGKLEIWSELGAGTEVELIVPGTVAYTRQASRRSWPFRSKVGTNS